MPCDTIQTAQLELGKVDPATLKATMERLGVSAGDYTLNKAGILTLRGAATYQGLTVEKVRREVSRTIVTAQAKRFGFSVKETKDGKLQLMKKAF